jgi:hypothetical protein
LKTDASATSYAAQASSGKCGDSIMFNNLGGYAAEIGSFCAVTCKRCTQGVAVCGDKLPPGSGEDGGGGGGGSGGVLSQEAPLCLCLCLEQGGTIRNTNTNTEYDTIRNTVSEWGNTVGEYGGEYGAAVEAPHTCAITVVSTRVRHTTTTSLVHH